jgi:hypothetical protein
VTDNRAVTNPFPTLRTIVLDSTDARALAEFYRQLLGYAYRSGDEPGASAADNSTEATWLVLTDPASPARLAFQRVDRLPPATWPEDGVPQQVHLDLTVEDRAELDRQHERALALGARLLQDRSSDESDPLRVYADPAGHPFCIFLSANG